MLYDFAVAPTRTVLQGEAKKTADKVVDLPEARRNIRRLLTTENLVKYKFFNPGTESDPMKQTARARQAAPKEARQAPPKRGREAVPTGARVPKSPKASKAREQAKGKRHRDDST